MLNLECGKMCKTEVFLSSLMRYLLFFKSCFENINCEKILKLIFFLQKITIVVQPGHGNFFALAPRAPFFQGQIRLALTNKGTVVPQFKLRKTNLLCNTFRYYRIIRKKSVKTNKLEIKVCVWKTSAKVGLHYQRKFAPDPNSLKLYHYYV